MSEAKFTEGPLQVLDHQQDGVFILDAGSRTLAKVVYLLNPHERMANAHLFAAAPELLGVLAGLMELERRDRFMPIGREWDAARAAINKATGAA